MMRRVVATGFCLAICACGAYAQKPAKAEPHLLEEAEWHGKNGKSIRGVYVGENAEVIFVSNLRTGRQFKLNRTNLSEGTLAWLERAKTRESGDGPGIMPKPEKDPFVPLDASKLKRSDVPSLAQGEYGHKASDCLPNSYAMFFAWWDRAGVLEIPKGRDDDDKAHWIHKEFARKFATRNNSGTYHEEVRKGMADYFERHFEGAAKFDLQQDYDFRPVSLAAKTVGANATVLSVTTYNGRKMRGGHAVSLLEADAEGNVVFNTWGETFRGKMKELEPSKAAPWRQEIKERYEIVLDPAREIPRWMERQELRFLLEPENWDSVSVLKVSVKPEAEAKDDKDD